MAGYNRIIIIGNLTRDPDSRQLPSGQTVCQLGLASNRQYKNKQTGSMVQEVCFIDVDVFGPQAESCKQFLQKGRSVLIEGRLKFDSWESPEGQKRNKHSIVADRVVFLSFGQGNDSEGMEKSNSVTGAVTAGDDLEKELLGGLESSTPKAPRSAKPKKEQSTTGSTNDFSFKDEPPFQDDLPF